MTRILIADDSDTFVRETKEILRDRGWKVESVRDADQAREALSTESFDAIVLDRLMPGEGSGDDVLRWIRSRSELQDLCVVMLTAYRDIDSAVECLRLGAFQYLGKPLRFHEQLFSILCAGIAWHKANAMRRSLLASTTREELFQKVRSVILEALQPDGVHILFVGNDGKIEDIVSEVEFARARGSHPSFVDRIMTGSQVVFGQDAATVGPLEPILPGARTLLAVPVPGAKGTVTGVLDMESTRDHAFDPSWSQVLRYFADLIGIALEIEAQTAARVQAQLKIDLEREKLRQLDLVYREFKHSIATHVQIVSMQAGELLADVGTPHSERDKRILQRARFIANNANVVETVIQDLKVLAAAPPKLDLNSVELAQLLQGCLANFATELEESDIRLIETTVNSELRVLADRSKLEYCLVCLVRNAVEAIDEGRKQASTLEEDRHDSLHVEVQEDGPRVRIDIRDSGIGFEPDMAETLFQPLFSTKVRKPEIANQANLTGAERVERILKMSSVLAPELLDRQSLAEFHRGGEILIQDDDALSISLIQGPSSDKITLGEFKRAAVTRLRTAWSQGGDWPNRGIGLYSVRRIIAEHGGTITASSKGVGRGAVFSIALPQVVR